MSFLSRIGIAVFVTLMLACGTEESSTLTEDCRTDAQNCMEGMSCQPDANDNYVCMPENQGGSAGQVEPNGGASGSGGTAGEAGQAGQIGPVGLAGSGGSGGQAGEAGNDEQGGMSGQAGSEPPFCGDGVQNGSEACDDGNEIDDDACSNDCEINEPPIDPPTGPYSLTFNVRMDPGYTGGVTVGNNLQGWNTAGTVQLQDNDRDGVYSGSMLVDAGERIEFKYIRGYDGSGMWENVPSDCGYVTGQYSNRSVVMPAQDLVLPVVKFGTCEFDEEPNPGSMDNPFSPNDVSGDCSPNTRRIRFRVNTADVNQTGGQPCVFGSFNDWRPDQYPMVDPDGDGVFELELAVTTQAIEYKFNLCGQDVYEDLPDQDGCTLRTGEYVNRIIPAGSGDEVRNADCFNGCGACDDEDPEAFNHPWFVCQNAPGRPTPITLAGRRLVEGSRTVHWKGVAWQPYGIGQGPGVTSPPWASAVEQDAALMVSAGINAVRTYGVISNRTVLDHLHSQGISVLMTVFYGYGDTPESAINHVCALKDHPAIAGWLVGNEWNLNMLGRNVGFNEAADAVEQVIRAIRMNDSTRPVSTVYGGLPSNELLSCMSESQAWGLNVYTGASFGGLFAEWAGRSTRPMYFGEYGADAYDTRINAENESLQADIVASLTNEIHTNSARTDGVCTGGMVFEFNDEWWKYASGDWGVHDTANSWENGAYPDPGMQEEWWGLVRIDRTVREALRRYGTLTPPAE
ncbi:MAG: glycoside hydrolase family 2 TIM barrel-domain containing protein [Bradymonadia bacterium]